MAWTEDELKIRLAGRHILIIEDDPDLAPRLERLFRKYGATNVVVRRCVNGAEQGGLDLLRKSGFQFDVVCVDIVLPWDETALKEGDALLGQWNELQLEVVASRESPDSPERLSDVRERLNAVSSLMRRCVVRDAGVKMIEEWLKTVEDSGSKVRVLFLTARQERVGESDKKMVSHLRWLTKPATPYQIITAVAELLCE